MNFKKNGLLVILSSPSGGGKTTIYRKILELHPEFAYSVSVTTRAPRMNEKNGTSYHFVNDAEFDKLIDKGAFIEWAYVHNCRYGTLKETVDNFLANDKVVFFDLDVQGTLNMKKHYPDCVSIFILPPSFEKLKRRLINRKTDSGEVLKTRIKNAVSEVGYWLKYDYLVINDEFEDTVQTVEAIIKAEMNRASVYREFNWEIPEGILI